MQIWVDADACPNAVKDIIFRAAERLKLVTTLVANHLPRVPTSPWIRAIQVPQGADMADSRIVSGVEAGDLVITADIPLAAAVLERGAHAIDMRGDAFTPANIAERLSLRQFMEELRSSGVNTGGPPPFSQSDRQAFANQLDRLLTRLHKG